MSQTLSIIIPAYNEEATIVSLLEKVVGVDLIDNMIKEIIIVNDASSDNTAEEVRKTMASFDDVNIRLIELDRNQGKGAALHKGIALATGNYVIIQDADLEYDPNEYNILLKPILDGYADVVYGSRFIGGKPHRILFFWHSIGNKILTRISNAFTNLNMTDMETCYKLWKRDIIQSVDLKEKRFGFEPEVTAKVSRLKNVRIYEVGISYYGRSYADGKKIGWRDGFRAIYAILKYNLWAR